MKITIPIVVCLFCISTTTVFAQDQKKTDKSPAPVMRGKEKETAVMQKKPSYIVSRDNAVYVQDEPESKSQKEAVAAQSKLRNIAHNIQELEKKGNLSDISTARKNYIKTAEKSGVSHLGEEEKDFYIYCYKLEYPNQYEEKFDGTTK